MKGGTFISIKFYFVEVRPLFQPVRISLYLCTIPRGSVGVSPGGCCLYNSNHLGGGKWRWMSELTGLVFLSRHGGWLTNTFAVFPPSYNSAAHCPHLLGSFVCLVTLLRGCRERKSPGRERDMKKSSHCARKGQPGPILSPSFYLCLHEGHVAAIIYSSLLRWRRLWFLPWRLWLDYKYI